jgi:hypothetical protein
MDLSGGSYDPPLDSECLADLVEAAERSPDIAALAAES